jgi:hypothetical protein
VRRTSTLIFGNQPLQGSIKRNSQDVLPHFRKVLEVVKSVPNLDDV